MVTRGHYKKNTIILELEKARCEDLIRNTEDFLCKVTELSPTTLKTYYTEFLQNIEVTDHQISPELQHILQNAEEIVPSQTVSISNPVIQQSVPSENSKIHQASSSIVPKNIQLSQPENSIIEYLSPPENAAIFQPLSSKILPSHQSLPSTSSRMHQQPNTQMNKRRNILMPPKKIQRKSDQLLNQQLEATKQPHKIGKRKGAHTQPPAMKKLKIDHFLVKRQNLSHNPT